MRVGQVSLDAALEVFKEKFSSRYPDNQFLIDGDGYEDEELDLNIYVDGDEVEIGKYAAAVSALVQQQTGCFILAFILPSQSYPLTAA